MKQLTTAGRKTADISVFPPGAGVFFAKNDFISSFKDPMQRFYVYFGQIWGIWGGGENSREGSELRGYYDNDNINVGTQHKHVVGRDGVLFVRAHSRDGNNRRFCHYSRLLSCSHQQ